VGEHNLILYIVCGDHTFADDSRKAVVKIMKDYQGIDFVEVEYQPNQPSDPATSTIRGRTIRRGDIEMGKLSHQARRLSRALLTRTKTSTLNNDGNDAAQSSLTRWQSSALATQLKTAVETDDMFIGENDIGEIVNVREVL